MKTEKSCAPALFLSHTGGDEEGHQGHSRGCYELSHDRLLRQRCPGRIIIFALSQVVGRETDEAGTIGIHNKFPR
jgi:hypothetical protein